MQKELIIAGITSALSVVVGFLTAKRRYKAEVSGIEKTNERSEIENYQFVAKEWREAAHQWKQLADEYQLKLIENSKKIEDLTKEYLSLKAKLTQAQKRIAELEKHEK